MNLQSLRPASSYAINYGFKSVVYGPPGSAKTPLINTAPKPILLACEPGMLSMRNSTVPTATGFTVKDIDAFFEWLFKSNETKNFDTIAIDSISQMAEIYLEQALKENKHGLQAYGQMANDVMKQLRGIYYLEKKHTYLVAKQELVNNYKKPYMPGQQLPIFVPHLFDAILHLDIQNVPGVGQVRAFRCLSSIDTIARDRSGRLNEFEEPNFSKLVEKAFV